MMVKIEVNPVDVHQRLLKAASDATDENRHDDAFLMSLAADVIAAMIRERLLKDAS